MSDIGEYFGKSRKDAIERVLSFRGNPIPHYDGSPGDEVPGASIDAALVVLVHLPANAFPAPGADGSICIDYGDGDDYDCCIWIEADGTAVWSKVQESSSLEFATTDELIEFIRIGAAQP